MTPPPLIHTVLGVVLLPWPKIETTSHFGVEGRALSSMHAPVVWYAWLSPFFGQGSIGLNFEDRTAEERSV